ncbi:MAG: ribosome maturation factor RimP [Legionellales bacterium]|jgi:ribosome maturation factor RimP|nr:ribosome maturation factor RimP [Legionellales bacterium]
MGMIQTDIEQFVRPCVEGLGYELWGFQYLTQGRHGLLRIFIDHAQGVGIEDCEKVSRQISAVMDVEDPISGQYRLEISSPGIPRPLFYPEQYQRYMGETVEVKLSKPIDQKRKFTGKIVAADTQSLVLDLEEGLGQQNFSFNAIVKAHLISK